ncbi:hypothetical protein ACLQ22_30440 [Micromonospora sp. DT178]|uniref:hypothetical protein n=1 Tax=Micromonospora sp. DT178 TaxID=3393436 RepID=UPI003CFAA33E
MARTWVLITVAIAVLLGAAAAVRIAQQRRLARLTPMERARRATHELGQEKRALRNRSPRGTGEHFGKTKIRKYGDERREDAQAEGGFYSDSHSDSGGGSSW